MSGLPNSGVTGLIAGLLLVGGIVGWTFVRKAEYERNAREQLISEIATLEGYADDRTLIDSIVTRAHEVAFDAAYQWRFPSNRNSRQPAFRPDTYHQHAYVEIIRALQTAGREDLAAAAERLRARR